MSRIIPMHKVLDKIIVLQKVEIIGDPETYTYKKWMGLGRKQESYGFHVTFSMQILYFTFNSLEEAKKEHKALIQSMDCFYVYE